MPKSIEFIDIDLRIAFTDLMVQLNKGYLEYFGNPNCVLIMHVIHIEQYEKFRTTGIVDYSVGVTLDYAAERTGLPRSTIHDQMNKMMKKNIFIKDGRKFKFKIGADGIPEIQKELPNGVKAINNFLNYVKKYDFQNADTSK